MAERSKRTGINADRVLRELGRIAFVNPKDVLDLQTAEVKPDTSDDDLAVIAGMKVKYVPHKTSTKTVILSLNRQSNVKSSCATS